MRKAEKRRLGVIKQQKNLAEAQAHGLKMQEHDRKRRENEFQQALIARDRKSSKAEPGRSKISQEKVARVAARLVKKEDIVTEGVTPPYLEYAEADVALTEKLWKRANPSLGIDLIRKKTYSESDLERLHAEELLDLKRRDDIYKEAGTCDKYGCVFETKAQHEDICPGNVSFRPSRHPSPEFISDLQDAVSGKVIKP